MVFDSLWKTFNSRFQAILESMRKHRDLIDREANAISIADAKVWRNQWLKSNTQWREERADAIDKAEKERLSAQVCPLALASIHDLLPPWELQAITGQYGRALNL